jgi:predicted nucleic acid-binding protein
VKIVVDANLFASSLMKPKSNPGKILGLVKQNKVELILSPAIMRPLKNAQFCSSSRKAKILTTGIH